MATKLSLAGGDGKKFMSENGVSRSRKVIEQPERDPGVDDVILRRREEILRDRNG